MNKIDEVEKRSSNQSFRTEPRRSSMGSMSNLGTTNRSSQKSSLYQHKFSINNAMLNSMSSAELKSERKPNMISVSNNQHIKNYYNQNGDDKFKHLEFLNLFEERMKQREKK